MKPVRPEDVGAVPGSITPVVEFVCKRCGCLVIAVTDVDRRTAVIAGPSQPADHALVLGPPLGGIATPLLGDWSGICASCGRDITIIRQDIVRHLRQWRRPGARNPAQTPRVHL